MTDTARKTLAKLDRQTAKRITVFLRKRVATDADPRAVGKPLNGPLGDFWRYRVGDYRLVCDIQDNVMRVLVVLIGKRDEVYSR